MFLFTLVPKDLSFFAKNNHLYTSLKYFWLFSPQFPYVPRIFKWFIRIKYFLALHVRIIFTTSFTYTPVNCFFFKFLSITLLQEINTK